MNDFLIIPGVGKRIAQDLWNLGYRRVTDLKDADPEAMYERLLRDQHQNPCRCKLYVFRAIIYYASTPHPDPEKLNWWHWKD